MPPLAPLFARMTTHDIERRFTASEALAFFQEHLASHSEDVLNTSIAPTWTFDMLDNPDLYWKHLAPADRE